MKEELGTPMNPSADDPGSLPQPDTGTKAGDRKDKVEVPPKKD